MLLTSVIIVLREVLEAALLIAVLLSSARFAMLQSRWLGISGVVGLFGAFIFSSRYGQISDWFDGVGYEVMNASMQLAIYCLILGIIWLLLQVGEKSKAVWQGLGWLMGLAVCLAIVREGSEIVLYFSGFLHSSDNLSEAVFGSIIGVGVGFSLGALIYYLLLSFQNSVALCAAIALLIMVAGGMCSQAAMLLIQADWLPAQQALWDSSGWLSESSVMGQLLYALIGYEATPSALQVALYLSSMGIALIMVCSSYLLSSARRAD